MSFVLVLSFFLFWKTASAVFEKLFLVPTTTSASCVAWHTTHHLCVSNVQGLSIWSFCKILCTGGTWTVYATSFLTRKRVAVWPFGPLFSNVCSTETQGKANGRKTRENKPQAGPKNDSHFVVACGNVEDTIGTFFGSMASPCWNGLGFLPHENVTEDSCCGDRFTLRVGWLQTSLTWKISTKKQCFESCCWQSPKNRMCVFTFKKDKFFHQKEWQKKLQSRCGVSSVVSLCLFHFFEEGKVFFSNFCTLQRNKKKNFPSPHIIWFSKFEMIPHNETEQLGQIRITRVALCFALCPGTSLTEVQLSSQE